MVDQGDSGLDYRSVGAQPLGPDDPRRIGAFPLHAVLGSGGMGRVYLGLAPTGYTAVKRVLPFLAADETFLRHFSQELDNQARLPAGVSARLLAADRTARPPWFATEYIPGVTLHEAVHLEGRSLAPAHLWLLLRELAARLAPVHALGMMHRDLKPSNVMLTESGVTLIDFGVARAADQSAVTATGVAVGTPAFMAPEQARAQRDLTPAVDVFSLGSLLAFAASGTPPFGEGSGHDVFYRIVHQEPDLAPVRAADPVFAGIVESCLKKEPGERPSAAELAEFAAANALPGPVNWPSVATARIAARKAFAAAAPPLEPDPTGPDVPEAAPLPETVPLVHAAPAPEAFRQSAPEPFIQPPLPSPSSVQHTERRPRKAVLLVAIPLLLLGTTGGTLAAMNDLPFVSKPGSGASTDNAGGANGGLAGRGSATPTATKSAAVPSAHATMTPSTSQTSPSAAPKSVTTTESTSGGTSGGGTTGGSRSSGGSGGSSGGSSGSTAAGASKTTAPAGSPPAKMASFDYYVGSCVGYCDPYDLSLSWTAESNATSYDIHYQNTTTGVDTIINVTGTSYVITTTKTADHVCLQMRADNQYGDSAWNPVPAFCYTMPY